MINKTKMPFVEFIARSECEDFDALEDIWMKWAIKYVEMLPEILKNEIHAGDCTKQCSPCSYCQLETMLSDYKEYSFNPEKYRKENGI